MPKKASKQVKVEDPNKSAQEEAARLKKLQDKLQQQEQVSKENLLKLNDKWRTSLRQTYALDLLQDFGALTETFDRIVQCKDNVIHVLVAELSETEKHSSLAHGSHLQQVDQLLNVHKRHLETLESHWNTSCKELGVEYSAEREQMFRQHQKEIEYLKAETFILGQHYAEINRGAREDYQRTCNGIEKRYTEDKNVLHRQISDTLNQFQLESTNFNSEATEWLCAVETLNDQKADLQMRQMQITKLQDTINDLCSHLSIKVVPAYEREECERVAHNVRQLRSNLCSAQAAGRSRLSHQTMCSYNAIKKTQDIIGEGELLLHLAERCCQLETDKDEMFPHYSSFLHAEELRQVKTHAMMVMSEELGKKMMDYPELKTFWQRYSKVLVERLCLEKEKEILDFENQQLMVLLQEHLNEEQMNVFESEFHKEMDWFLPASLRNDMTVEMSRRVRLSTDQQRNNPLSNMSGSTTEKSFLPLLVSPIKMVRNTKSSNVDQRTKKVKKLAPDKSA